MKYPAPLYYSIVNPSKSAGDINKKAKHEKEAKINKEKNETK